MPVEVILPKVDMDMETGTIEAWKVAEGEAVTEGQLLFEIGTSKAVMEVESPASGIIRRISAKPGETVAVGTPVAWIYRADERMEAIPASALQPSPPVAANDREPTRPEGIRATPLARRLAREAGLDLRSISGSGPRGRIGEADIRNALSHPAVASHPSPAMVQHPAPRDVEPGAAGELRPFSSVRRIIAQRLTESATRVPHFRVEARIEMASAQNILKRLSPVFQAKAGVKPSFSALLVHVLGRVLANHPLLNASVEGEAVRLHPARHIGIAMDRDGDLVVPVLRNAGAGSLMETAMEFDRLKRAVQARTLKPSEMEGGTFSLSNLGMFGVDRFDAILNPPQTGILAVGRTVETPIGRDGAIVLAPIAHFCLSADHRVVDGVVAARFMAELRAMIETPELLL